MCSACLTRHGDGWDVHGHPTLPWGRSRTSDPVREGQRARWNGRVPSVLLDHARPPDGQPVGERVHRRLEAALTVPSRRDNFEGSDPRRERGRACENAHGPAPEPGTCAPGVAPHHAPSGSCATGDHGAKPQDLAAPADMQDSRCASPERQNVHRPPLTLAHLRYGSGHQASQ